MCDTFNLDLFIVRYFSNGNVFVHCTDLIANDGGGGAVLVGVPEEQMRMA